MLTQKNAGSPGDDQALFSTLGPSYININNSIICFSAARASASEGAAKGEDADAQLSVADADLAAAQLDCPTQLPGPIRDHTNRAEQYADFHNNPARRSQSACVPGRARNLSHHHD